MQVSERTSRSCCCRGAALAPASLPRVRPRHRQRYHRDGGRRRHARALQQPLPAVVAPLLPPCGPHFRTGGAFLSRSSLHPLVRPRRAVSSIASPALLPPSLASTALSAPVTSAAAAAVPATVSSRPQRQFRRCFFAPAAAVAAGTSPACVGVSALPPQPKHQHPPQNEQHDHQHVRQPHQRPHTRSTNTRTRVTPAPARTSAALAPMQHQHQRAHQLH